MSHPANDYYIEEAREEIERLQDINESLLEACKDALDTIEDHTGDLTCSIAIDSMNEARDTLQEAINKAKETK